MCSQGSCQISFMEQPAVVGSRFVCCSNRLVFARRSRVSNLHAPRPNRPDVSLLTDQHPLLPRFKGVGLIAPAIQGNPPPAPVVFMLRYLVAPLCPRTQIPDFLDSGEIKKKR